MRLGIAASLLTLLVSSLTAAEPPLAWMQSTLAAWEVACRQDLHIAPDPLPWIIFYDDTHSWHIRPDKRLLPLHRRTNYSLRFAGRRYAICEVAHRSGLWIPGRPPLNLKARAVTMPYDGDRKAFFV